MDIDHRVVRHRRGGDLGRVSFSSIRLMDFVVSDNTATISVLRAVVVTKYHHDVSDKSWCCHQVSPQCQCSELVLSQGYTRNVPQIPHMWKQNEVGHVV